MTHPRVGDDGAVAGEYRGPEGPGGSRRGRAMRRVSWAAGLLTAVLASAAPAAAEEAKSPDVREPDEAKASEPKAKPPKAEEVPVYTNEDLERLGPDPYAPRPPAPAAPESDTAKPSEDPLRKLEGDQASTAGQAAIIAAAEREAADAEEAVRAVGKSA